MARSEHFRHWNAARAHEADVLARPPERITAQRVIPCVCCPHVIKVGEPALYKLRVGVAHVACGEAAWCAPATGGAA